VQQYDDVGPRLRALRVDNGHVTVQKHRLARESNGFKTRNP
jgi:hypothetical protein